MAKYPTTTGYWVYTHRTPDNMYYPGYSGGKDGKKQPCQRWRPSKYKATALYPYIEQYDWDNIEHLVVKDGLTKEQAVYWEERLIKLYSELGCLINNYRSGNCTADIKAYKQQYNQQYNQRSEVKEYHRQYDQRPEMKVYNRVNAYNNHYPNRKLITPLEAKEMYLLTGYIPDFIKKDDLF